MASPKYFDDLAVGSTKPFKSRFTEVVTTRPIPFPINALPAVVGEFVAAAAAAIGCDASFVALPLLACLARAIGNKRVIRLKRTWTEPAIIWGAIVGRSGSHKSPALQAATQFLQQRESLAFAAHAKAAEKHEFEMLCYRRALAAWRKEKYTTMPPPWKPELPSCERFLTSDVTIEALAVLLAGQVDGLLVVRDELAGWVNGIAEYKGGRGSDLGHWLAAWSGAPLTVDRKSGEEKTLHVPRGAVNLVGGIQQGVLRSAIGRKHLQDGLCARLLLAMPDPKPVQWSEAVVNSSTEAALGAVFEKLFELEPAADAEDNPEPFPLDLTREAKELWIDYYNRHRAESADLDDDVAAAWSKLEAYAARFALIYQLCAWAEGDASGDAIGESAIRAGIELSDWFGNEAKRVYELFVESDADRETRELLELIQRRGGAVTARELAHASRHYRGAGKAEAALERLAKSGFGSWQVEPTEGRPRSVFKLHPVNADSGNGTMADPEDSWLPLPLPPLPRGNGQAGEAAT